MLFSPYELCVPSITDVRWHEIVNLVAHQILSDRKYVRSGFHFVRYDKTQEKELSSLGLKVEYEHNSQTISEKYEKLTLNINKKNVIAWILN